MTLLRDCNVMNGPSTYHYQGPILFYNFKMYKINKQIFISRT